MAKDRQTLIERQYGGHASPIVRLVFFAEQDVVTASAFGDRDAEPDFNE